MLVAIVHPLKKKPVLNVLGTLIFHIQRLLNTRVIFSFTPAKYGAFIIVPSQGQEEKVVLSDGPFVESVFEFGGVNGIFVYWSDGIEIERTPIEIIYE